MILSNTSIFQADYISVEPWHGVDGSCERPNHQSVKIIQPKRFQGEIKALCDYAGVESLTPGMQIKMSLQEILTVIPKTRQRTDSYNSLVGFLRDEMAVELTIKSNKTK